ncbi:MAG: DUF2330 domain-containing protein [Myxococcales bacterium]
MKQTYGATGAAVGLALAASSMAAPASACGGFFCSQAAGVNQAAERIVFAKNADDTVTAVIEILYQGPSDKFSWLLPISTVPQGDQIAVASSLAFQRLQQATNPQYRLSVRVEGTCEQEPDDGFASAGGAGSEGGAGGASATDGTVTVEASGLVGSFEWTVISVEPGVTEPADAAVTWLEENHYDVPPGAPGLLGPYLEDGMHLLALRLQKGATTGSIRPIVLTYDAKKPMIPIKLTAVAANDDMGVLTWVLGDTRAVPQNYYALELNEARIDWFNPGRNYDGVVTAAADEAGGQGFVTEYADESRQLGGVVWRDYEETDWRRIKAGLADATPTVRSANVVEAVYDLSAWDGFWAAFEKHVSWPDRFTLAEVQVCPDCYGLEYIADDAFAAALEEDVVAPARRVQQLLDAHPYVTRLYSTLSAAEMTVDPLFTFNATLPTVSNLHVAERIIECGRGYYEYNAPWRIELPQGGVVRGGPGLLGIWPTAFDSQPANRRILRVGESGGGKVLEDNSSAIDADIRAYSDSVPVPPHGPDFPRGRGPNFDPGGGGDAGSEGGAGSPTHVVGSAEALEPSGGCAFVAKRSPDAWLLVLAAAGLLRRRRIKPCVRR